MSILGSLIRQSISRQWEEEDRQREVRRQAEMRARQMQAFRGLLDQTAQSINPDTPWLLTNPRPGMTSDDPRYNALRRRFQQVGNIAQILGPDKAVGPLNQLIGAAPAIQGAHPSRVPELEAYLSSEKGLQGYYSDLAKRREGVAKRNQTTAKDAEGYLRYVNTGKRVFPDVTKPTEAKQRRIVKGADGRNYYADTQEPVLPNVKVPGEQKDRRIIKGADGRNYYADTQEPVLPNVQAPPAQRPTAKDVQGHLRYVDTGERVFPDATKPASNRRVSQDAQGYLRYVDDGKRVFPEVQKVEKPGDRKTAKDAEGYLRYVDTGERVFPGAKVPGADKERRIVKGPDGRNYYADTQEAVLPDVATPASKRNTAKDASGYLRYMDTGERVFPDVAEKPKELKPTDVRAEQKAWGRMVDQVQEAEDKFIAVTRALSRATAGGDLEAIIEYAKALDPTSVVREGEVTTIRNTAALPDWLYNSWNLIKRGGQLTASQRREIAVSTKDRYMDRKVRFTGERRDFERSLERYQDPNMREWVIGTSPVFRLDEAGVENQLSQVPLPPPESEEPQGVLPAIRKGAQDIIEGLTGIKATAPDDARQQEENQRIQAWIQENTAGMTRDEANRWLAGAAQWRNLPRDLYPYAQSVLSERFRRQGNPRLTVRFPSTGETYDYDDEIVSTDVPQAQPAQAPQGLPSRSGIDRGLGRLAEEVTNPVSQGWSDLSQVFRTLREEAAASRRQEAPPPAPAPAPAAEVQEQPVTLPTITVEAASDFKDMQNDELLDLAVAFNNGELKLDNRAAKMLRDALASRDLLRQLRDILRGR